MSRSHDQSMWEAGAVPPAAREHRVVDVRATGVMPHEVADQVEQELNRAAADGWELERIQPVIYNSSTTGYLLLIFGRVAPGGA
ncbi:MAG: hypothetical protein ACRDGO_09615 [Actinomycetota bacterium]